MRLLFLLPAVPLPADSGAKLRNLGLLRLAAEQHEVDAIAFGTADDEARLRELGHHVALVEPPRVRSRRQRLGQVVISRLPDMAHRYESQDFASAVNRMLLERSYDAVQVEGIEMARYLELVRPAQRIYDAHNAEFLLQQRASDTAASATAKLYSRLQWQRLARFERAVVRSSRLSLAVSEHDANQLLALANGCARVAVVPNGIDVAAYTFRQPREHDAPNVLFLGKLDYRPNAEAIQWFLDAVFDRLTDARVFAVGGAPPAWLIKRGQLNDRIAVTGYVHDERPYLERAALLVLPTRAAGGARLKALVAMASGVPILSTRLGMEGLDAEPGRHFWCAETSEQWVAAVDRLLRDASLRQRLAREARVLVEHTYDWSAIRPALGAAYARFAR